MRPLPHLLPLMLALGSDLWARGASGSPSNWPNFGSAWPFWNNNFPIHGNNYLDPLASRDKCGGSNNPWLMFEAPTPWVEDNKNFSTVAYQDYLQTYWQEIANGLQRYVQHPVFPTQPHGRIIWQIGNAKLYAYGEPHQPPVLLVPSLVNGAQIMDLLPDHSLAQWLAEQGIASYLLDWGSPGIWEQQFNLDGYLSQILLPALQRLNHEHRQSVTLLGYCMGGLLALAAAQLRPDLVKGLSLWATPWDFHASGYPSLPPKLWAQYLTAAEPHQQFPAEWLNLLFFWRDPLGALEKWRKLAQLTDPAAITRFVATEFWAQQGIPLALPLANDCFTGWFGQNTPHRQQWSVLGQLINPAQLALPTMLIQAQGDRIVPPASSAPLAKLIPHAWSLTPALGHVGLMASSRAPAQIWQPFLLWLKQLYA